MITCAEMTKTLDKLIKSNQNKNPDIARMYSRLKDEHELDCQRNLSRNLYPHETFIDQARRIDHKRVVAEQQKRNGKK